MIDNATSADELSTPQLLQRLSEQTSTLVKAELKLAQLEMKEKGKRAGIGIGEFGVAGVLAFYGVGVLFAAAVLGLAEALPGWASALIVAGALFVVAAVLALLGKAQVTKAVPPAPEQAIESTKTSISAVKGAAGR